MARTSKADHQTQGAAILDRLGGTTIPAALKKPVADLKSAQAALVAASKTAEAARLVRDDSVTAVGAADNALDLAVVTLAAKMTGARIGTRQNAFAGLSKYPPFKLTALAYADEVKEVLALTAKVKKAKPAADVAKAAAACEKLANGVTTALGKLGKPQLAYNRALASRDALILSWTKALDLLKKSAAVAWYDTPATYKEIFAAPERMQAPVHTRPKKAKAATPVATPPVSTPKP